MVSFETEKAEIKVYTREADRACYPAGLADSIHFAYRRAGEAFCPLHTNYGILFAKAAIREDDTLEARGLCFPGIFQMPKSAGQGTCYGIAAYVKKEGEPSDRDALQKDGQSQIALWTTRDFIDFKEEGVFDREAFAKEYPMQWTDTVEIDRALCDRAVLHWGQLKSVEVKVPEEAKIASPDKLEDIQATVVYSDGSTDVKRVAWDWANRKKEENGAFRVKGTVIRERYVFPLTKGYGDPVLLCWEGKYYYIATNDNVGDIGLYLREADDVDGLFRDDCEQHIILDQDEERGLVQTFWAPEFHVIGGELYILFAVSGKAWGPQCHLMRLKKGGRLIDPNAWEDPIRVVRQDGSRLTDDGITLDMTYLKAGENSYMVWSYRRGIGTPKDTGSMLYIARVSEKEPWKLESEPVLLSRPLYSWENVNGTINNEGPHAFVSGKKVYLAYSGGDACGYTYAIGLLTADEDADLLDLSHWTKSGYPVLHFCSVEGEYGPGHHSFFVSPQGKLMIAYHAEDDITHRLRCAGMHRVHFNLQGEPVFDMSAERDLSPELAQVETNVYFRGQ